MVDCLKSLCTHVVLPRASRVSHWLFFVLICFIYFFFAVLDRSLSTAGTCADNFASRVLREGGTRRQILTPPLVKMLLRVQQQQQQLLMHRMRCHNHRRQLAGLMLSFEPQLGPAAVKNREYREWLGAQRGRPRRPRLGTKSARTAGRMRTCRRVFVKASCSETRDCRSGQ